MTHIHFIQNFLQVKDPNIEFQQDYVEGIKNQEEVVMLCAQLERRPNHCPACGHVNEGTADMIRYGYTTSDILLGSFNRQAVFVRLKKQRFSCKHCQSTTVSRTPLVDRHCFISNELKRLILTDLSETKAMSLIAKELSVSSHTVIRVLNAYGSKQFKQATHLPENLALDEFKSVKEVDGQMSCLLLDNDTHQIIDVLPDRTQTHLLKYFQHFSIEERQQVKTITIDMYAPYYQFLQTLFPFADIIIDRFHIVQLLTRELNKLRVQVMNKSRSTNRPLYNKYKRYWKLLLKHPSDLAWKNYRPHPLFKWLTNPQGIVDYLLDQDPTLRASYDCVHHLIRLLGQSNRTAFFDSLTYYKSKPLPKGIKKALRTLFKFKDGIKNSLYYSYSNGPIEGMNNKIKTIKRTGYGYGNFTHLSYRIQLSAAFRDKQKHLPQPPYQWRIDAANKYNIA